MRRSGKQAGGRTQEIIFAHNPKVYNPRTREWLILAREHSTGRLVWISTNSGMVAKPPPDHIVSVGPPEKLARDKTKMAASLASFNAALKLKTNSVNSARTKRSGGTRGVVAKEKKNSGSGKASASASGRTREPRLRSVPKAPADFRKLISENVRKGFKKKRCFSFDDGAFASRSSAKSGRKLKNRKPKHPKTGYNYFQLTVREQLSKDIPQESNRVLHNEKVARIIGQRWKALAAQERQIFQNMAEKDKIRYENEMKIYLETMRASRQTGRLAPAESHDHIPFIAESPNTTPQPTFRRVQSATSDSFTSSIFNRPMGFHPSSHSPIFGPLHGSGNIFSGGGGAGSTMSPQRSVAAGSGTISPSAMVEIFNQKNKMRKHIRLDQINKSQIQNGIRFVTSARSFDSKQPPQKRPRMPGSKLHGAKTFDFGGDASRLGGAGGGARGWSSEIFRHSLSDHFAGNPEASSSLQVGVSSPGTRGLGVMGVLGAASNSSVSTFGGGGVGSEHMQKEFDVGSWLEDVFDDKSDDWTEQVAKETNNLIPRMPSFHKPNPKNSNNQKKNIETTTAGGRIGNGTETEGKGSAAATVTASGRSSSTNSSSVKIEKDGGKNISGNISDFKDASHKKDVNGNASIIAQSLQDRSGGGLGGKSKLSRSHQFDSLGSSESKPLPFLNSSSTNSMMYDDGGRFSSLMKPSSGNDSGFMRNSGGLDAGSPMNLALSPTAFKSNNLPGIKEEMSLGEWDLNADVYKDAFDDL
mmetsp:Transcript_17461/g.31340  ORF Transcript_17461/g.31340 Transcript_17461/m.31340 type:complete len:754 (+) Transcript_17461:147-2408(+)